MAGLRALAAIAACAIAAVSADYQIAPITDQMRQDANAIIAVAQPADGSIPTLAFDRLAEMVDTFGPRFSGSQNLEDALSWIAATAAADGLVVTEEPTLVPQWIRGKEYARLVSPRPKELHMVGLGMSIGTGGQELTADVLVVRSQDELTANCSKAVGKIVLFNAAFVSYGATVTYRSNAGTWAAACGAVAALVRSVGPFGIQTPHTGATKNASIPAAAVSWEDSAQMQRMQDRGQQVTVTLYMEAYYAGLSPSRNVIMDIPGSERPGEYVLVGGHADSWDIAEGAMDDGGGLLVSWEALRLIKSLGIVPKRTLRAVAFVNEENGVAGPAGGTQYAVDHADSLANHSLMIESDNGAFAPFGLGFSGHGAAKVQLQVLAPLLAPLGSGNVSDGGGGVDIDPSCSTGVPCASPTVYDVRMTQDSNNPCLGYTLPTGALPAGPGDGYFWYHHTAGDTPERMDPRQLNVLAASMAIWALSVANLPELLPRDGPVPPLPGPPDNGGTGPHPAAVAAGVILGLLGAFALVVIGVRRGYLPSYLLPAAVRSRVGLSHSFRSSATARFGSYSALKAQDGLLGTAAGGMAGDGAGVAAAGAGSYNARDFAADAGPVAHL